MKFVLDMNIPASWVQILQNAGWEALHWSQVGDPRADDSDILAWAATNEYILITHDLDFGELLVLTRSKTPSVLQIRASDMLAGIEQLVVAAIQQCQNELKAGALVSFSAAGARVRMLPFKQ